MNQILYHIKLRLAKLSTADLLEILDLNGVIGEIPDLENVTGNNILTSIIKTIRNGKQV